MRSCGVYLVRPYQHEKRNTLYGRTFSKLWTKKKQTARFFAFFVNDNYYIFLLILSSHESGVRRHHQPSSASSSAILFCHFVSGWLRFASVVASFIYIFILTTSFCCSACSISFERFIGRHRSVAGSHYSLFYAKHEIREHGGTANNWQKIKKNSGRHFPLIIRVT